MSSSSINCKVSSPSTLNLLYLPDDLLWNCLARFSRLYYPTLSLVSKSFRSLIASTELYKTRTLLGFTESCLYACIQSPHDSTSTLWFPLCRKPIQISDPNPSPNPRPSWFALCFSLYRSLKNHTRKKEKKSSENVLVSIPSCKSPFVEDGGVIAVGCNIYKIAGYLINREPSSTVYIMDCRSHTWHEAPSMRMTPKFPRVSVLDGKIYVMESYISFGSSNLIECFDPKTRKWEDVPSPGEEIRGHGTYVSQSLAMEGKLYLFGDKDVVYKPKENKWDEVGSTETFLRCCDPRYSCVIDNVLYSSGYGSSAMLNWYDSEGRTLRVLKGLETLPKLDFGKRFKLVNNGGKIAVFWEEEFGSDKTMIWCAEISLERHSKEEIYGKIEWCNVVLTVPKECRFKQFISATV